MKSIVMFLLIGVIVLSAPLGLHGQTKKYDIKSGIITFQNTTTIGTMKIQEKSIVYFDDYGMKECKESYQGNEIKEINMSDGKTLWAIQPPRKKAFKRGDAYRGTEMRFDWNEVSKKDKESGKAKMLPNVTIAGKSCESFEVATSGKTVFAGWKKICLLMDITNPGMKIVMKAVKVEENAKIPAEKFKVPAGFSVE